MKFYAFTAGMMVAFALGPSRLVCAQSTEITGQDLSYKPMSLAAVQSFLNQAQQEPITETDMTRFSAETMRSLSVHANAGTLKSHTNIGSRAATAAAAVALNAPVAGSPTPIGTNSITANWTANGNPNGTTYHVEISAHGFPSILQAMTTTALSATFTGLNSQTQYYMHVCVVDPNGGCASGNIDLPSASTLEAENGGAGPISYSARDAGVFGNDHYWELYWELPKGIPCGDSEGFPFQENIQLAQYPHAQYPEGLVQQSYSGPSGYSPNVCQVNVYAPVGSGESSMVFTYSIGYPVKATGNFVTLLF